MIFVSTFRTVGRPSLSAVTAEDPEDIEMWDCGAPARELTLHLTQQADPSQRDTVFFLRFLQSSKKKLLDGRESQYSGQSPRGGERW